MKKKLIVIESIILVFIANISMMNTMMSKSFNR